MRISCVNGKKAVLYLQVTLMLFRQVFSRNQLEMSTGVETIITVSYWGSLGLQQLQDKMECLLPTMQLGFWES